MKDTNTVIIAGRLTRDSEMSFTNSGTTLVKLSLAVNRSVKKNDQWEDEASFFDATIWGKRGEVLNQYLSKGQQVIITGELKQERWENEGQKRSKVTIHVNDIQLVGGKSSSQIDQQEYSPKTDPRHNTGFEDDIPF
jgi:single-strand DNA-binding protein